MVSLNEIKAQTNALKYLTGSLSRGRIASSYLFSGPEGVGKALCAKAFVKTLMCPEGGCGSCPVCRRIEGLQHPDLTWIKPEKNKAIRIEEVRQVKEALSLKPYEAPFSVCVMEDAHMMTQEASNALLKVLEEPPSASLMILVTSKKELLLETVLSRCSEVRFAHLPVEETKDIILEKAEGVREETAYFLAYFSQGSPGKALEMINENLQERRNSLIKLASLIMEEENASCLNWDTEDKNQLLEDLEMVIMLLRDAALAKEGLEDMALDKGVTKSGLYPLLKNQPIEKLYRQVERLLEIKLALLGNVNPKLVAQVLPGALK